MLVDLLHTVADSRPAATALGFGDGTWTWAKWRLAAARVAAELQRLGVRPGDTVGIGDVSGPGPRSRLSIHRGRRRRNSISS
jgi:acyl-CoA synthetase (AMP-forming)/AMP-acid ligase II